MWLHRLGIRHLKSIKKIDLTFTDDVTLIYGQNGMGKTTILEAISLLGHLPMMAQIKVSQSGHIETKHSSLVQMLETNKLIESNFMRSVAKVAASKSLFDSGLQTEVVSKLKACLPVTLATLDERLKTDPELVISDVRRKSIDTESHSGIRGNDLEHWFNHVNLERRTDQIEETYDGVMSFVVSFEKGSNSPQFTFYVYFRNVDHVSITKTLGRKAFDDIKMNSTYALVWADEHTFSVEKLLAHLQNTTKFLLPIEHRNDSEESLQLVKSVDYDETIKTLNENINRNIAGNYGFTFYLNTDLNDFGRGRDVRESVKDIFGDFIDEWIERLGIRFTENAEGNSKEFGFTSELQQVLNRILNPKILGDFNFWADSDDFKLASCSVVRKENGKWQPNIRVDRYNKNTPVELDYLSAGENECFFIFMYLLGTNINNSICLLDEPDLHLSQFSKKPFYTSLYSLLARKNEFGEDKCCQVIISTHSGSAYTDPEITKRLYIRKPKNKIEHESEHHFWYTARLAWQYLRISFAVMGWTFTVYGLLLGGMAALVSDAYTAFFQNEPESHVWVLHVIIYPIFYALASWHVVKCFFYVKRKLSYLER